MIHHVDNNLDNSLSNESSETILSSNQYISDLLQNIPCKIVNIFDNNFPKGTYKRRVRVLNNDKVITSDYKIQDTDTLVVEYYYRLLNTTTILKAYEFTIKELNQVISVIKGDLVDFPVGDIRDYIDRR